MQGFNEIGIRGILEAIVERDNITIVDPHTHILSDDVYQKNPEYRYHKSIEKNGIDFIFETEHNRLPLLYNSKSSLNGHVQPGIEFSTKYGHVNVLAEDNLFIAEAMKELQQYIFDSGKRNTQLPPTTLLNYIRDHHVVKDKDVAVVFPHSFQEGGIFYNEKNARYPKLWLPSTYKQRKYFLEWTNSKRSPDTKTGRRVLEMVQDPRQNLLLVAGSDAHHSSDVGMAGIIILDNVNRQDIIQNMFMENYLVYHIQLYDSEQGVVMLNTPRATDEVKFEFKRKENLDLKEL